MVYLTAELFWGKHISFQSIRHNPRPTAKLTTLLLKGLALKYIALSSSLMYYGSIKLCERLMDIEMEKSNV